MNRLLAVACMFLIFIVVSCVTSHVPEGKFLLKKNKLHVTGEDVDESSMAKVIRQQPNLSTLGIKFRLIVFNSIDSTKVEEKRVTKMNKLRRKNIKRKVREDRINERRRDRAIRKGRDDYYFRTIELKDTLNPKLSILERMKYKFGEPPVIVDSFLFEKSKEQLSTYMHKRGYYYETISGHLDTLELSKQKIIAHFDVTTGPRYYIDSVYIISDNPAVVQSFRNYLRKEQDQSALNAPFHNFLTDKKTLKVPFDQDVLNDYRDKVARYMRNDSYYMFSPSHVLYKADTNSADMSVKLGIVFTDRVIKDPNDPSKVTTKRQASTTVQAVYFHICDTILYEGNFEQYIEDNGLNLKTENFLTTVDTFYYAKLMKEVEQPDSLKSKTGEKYYKSLVNKNLFGQPKDSINLDKYRIATFTYNFNELPKKRDRKKVDESKETKEVKEKKETDEEKRARQEKELFVKPGLVEAQNYLEYTNFYKEYYADRTYNRLIQLGIFSIIKPVFEEVPGNKIIVHYYLVPAQKQSYGFEPRATNSNGYLGVSASINYTNKNLFKSGWNTTLSFSGGFESQPPVFSEVDGDKVKQGGRSFNTFEVGPTLKFDLPGLFPVNVAKLDKRQRPRTILSAAYNFQKRPDFKRNVFQLNYLWKFYVGKTQIVSIGLPAASVIKFVSLNPSPEFEARIKSLNDQFLINAYSDQLIWEDAKFVYEFDNLNYDKKKQRWRVTFNATSNIAGNLLYYGFRKGQDQDSTGRYKLFGVPYSQFALIDTKFITYYDVNRKHTIALRLLGGVGKPYKNTVTSLPYDYSFFSGGSNDNRGWDARTLGPGAYKYYLDPTRTFTQIGDIRLGTSLEYRLAKGKLLQSAFFLDASNIWTINNDVNRPGGRFSPSWYKELGVAVGYGVRLDFNFFIFRADLGIPVRNPGLPSGERWFWQDRDTYYQEIEDQNFTQDELKRIPDPFGWKALKLNIGIGLPF